MESRAVFPENPDKMIFSQIIDNQFMLNKKMDTVIDLLGKLTNTIIKYDNEYQQQIADEIQQAWIERDMLEDGYSTEEVEAMRDEYWEEQNDSYNTNGSFTDDEDIIDESFYDEMDGYDIDSSETDDDDFIDESIDDNDVDDETEIDNTDLSLLFLLRPLHLPNPLDVVLQAVVF